MTARTTYADNADMNVTPFVDVMLVLLIIFMVAAPIATISIPVDLPPPSPTQTMPEIDPVFVSASADGSIHVGGLAGSLDVKADWGTLTAAIIDQSNGDRTQRIMVRADQAVVYADVMRIMNILQQAGYDRVALVAETVCGTGEGEEAC